MITIDNRERRSLVPRELEKLKIPVEYVNLEVGDYVCVGKENVVISRKEVNDYIGSLSSGHLSNELHDLSTNYPFAILIVEGFIGEALMYRQMKRYNYLSSLVGSALKRSPDGCSGTISVLSAETPFDTALMLKFIHDKVNETNGLVRSPVLQVIKWKPEQRAVGILSAFPYVGEKRAKLILDTFKTLEGVCEASVEELMRIQGIGKVIAESVYKTWRNEE